MKFHFIDLNLSNNTLKRYYRPPFFIDGVLKAKKNYLAKVVRSQSANLGPPGSHFVFLIGVALSGKIFTGIAYSYMLYIGIL